MMLFRSQEDYEKKSAASEVVPMGSCTVEKGWKPNLRHVSVAFRYATRC